MLKGRKGAAPDARSSGRPCATFAFNRVFRHEQGAEGVTATLRGETKGARDVGRADAC